MREEFFQLNSLDDLVGSNIEIYGKVCKVQERCHSGILVQRRVERFTKVLHELLRVTSEIRDQIDDGWDEKTSFPLLAFAGISGNATSSSYFNFGSDTAYTGPVTRIFYRGDCLIIKRVESEHGSIVRDAEVESGKFFVHFNPRFFESRSFDMFLTIRKLIDVYQSEFEIVKDKNLISVTLHMNESF